jgi:fructose-1,6-bisphosphatase/sedoheptulose 1,7-bisphosphatase-like protein
MLYIGEPLGSQQGDPLALAADIAVDPLECTNHCAQDKPDALSVLAAAPRGALLHAPDCYMNKIAGSSLLKGRISLDTPVGDNLNAVSDVMGKPLSEITVIVMDRSRHIELISKIEGAGSKVRLIGDGDIAGALRAVEGEVDLLMGIGAAPEGVIAATAIKALGGVFESRLHFHKPEFRERAEKMMDDDVDRLWTEQDLCQSDDTLFVATGVCDGWLPEVSFEDGVIKTTSKIINGSDGSVEVITTNHEE